MGADRDIVIYGAGGHGMVVCDIALTGSAGPRVIGFADADPSKRGSRILDLPVLGTIDDLAGREIAVAMGIGANAARRRAFDHVLRLGMPVVTLVHRSAVLSPRAIVGHGVVVMANAAVNVEAQIGDGVILNTACSVDHHCVIGSHAHIAPGVTLAGNVRIGEETLVGAGAVVIPGIRIGNRCTIAAGAVVTADVADGTTVAGVPARVIAPAVPGNLQVS